MAEPIPNEVFELALVLFLSFLVGIEREEHKAEGGHYVFGGVRTFPLIGFVGYGLARLSGGNVLSLAIGFAVVGALMTVSYWHKVRANPAAGATTEISALLTYLVGALVHAGATWIAVSLGVLAVLLLELREALEKLTKRIARDEVLAFAKFLLLAVVILPVLPNRPFGPFAINPFRTWVVIVVVSGLSYASYVLQKWLRQRGVLVTALLGGAYSSTATTVVLSREGKDTDRPLLYAGSALAASGMMYLRIILLVLLFDPDLARTLAPSFCALGGGAAMVGAAMALAPGGWRSEATQKERPASNPLELRPAFLFGGAFVAMLVLTQLALQHVGSAGLYGLAAMMGFGDVDPFVLGLAQGGHASGASSLHASAAAVVIAAAANGVAKAGYARLFGGGKAGTLMFAAVLALAIVGLAPLLWI